VTLQQLRYLRAIVDEDFSVSRAALVLGTTQSAVSKQLRVLELEIGTDLIVRRTNRVVGLTTAGEAIIDAARRTLWEAENLQNITDELTKADSGQLVIATTHMYARHVLRPVITAFVRAHPDVQLVIRQGMPHTISEWVATGEADLGIGGRSVEPVGDLLLLPFGALERGVFVPKRHPLLRTRKPTLRQLAQFPIITLDVGTESEQKVTHAFQRAGLRPNVVLRAIDTDVVKSYVECGLGIAILPAVVHEPDRDRNVRVLAAGHLFEPTTPQVILRQGKHAPNFMDDFIVRVAPQWDRAAINAAQKSKPPPQRPRLRRRA
jgi:LysR family cys regulon transcriptional activator